MKWFLVNHGSFYGNEILHGCVFVPRKHEDDAERMRGVCKGDVFFHVSKAGISAVGVAMRPCRILPFPAWRICESELGDRGYLADLQCLLLGNSVASPFPKRRYLTELSEEEGERLAEKIEERNPLVSAFLGRWREKPVENS